MIPLRDSVRSRTWPFVNVLLILSNIAAFAFQLSLPPETLETFIRARAIVPAELFSNPAGEAATILSSMFLHGGWGHIIGNMLYLWIFGDNVEDRMGHGRYLFFYVLMGSAAALMQAYLNPASRIPMLGASGAIAGVLGAYLMLFPRATVLALVPFGVFTRLVEVPAVFFLGFWFVLQAVQGVGSLARAAGDTGGVAWWAHAGGFVAGLLLVPFFRKR